MKKKIITLACLLMTAALMLSACAGSVKIEAPQEDFNHVVYSNGGSAVQYGEYVYFINGTRGFADEDGKQNTWGNVVKGGIYRAKLNVAEGKRVNGVENVVAVRSNLEGSEQLFDFEIETVKKFGDRPDLAELEEEELDEEIDWVKNTAIAPKTVGTSGYAKGGIYIFDEYVYFATPNNEKNREGAVQTGYTDFWRMRLNGKDVKRVLTTKGEAANEPYGFYKSGDSVYLVCAYRNEESKLDVVSVRMQGKKIHNAVYLTQEAAAVYLPAKDTYDAEDKSVSLEDFVFYTRAVGEGDTKRTGNLIEVTSPDGAERFSLQEIGDTTQIEDVRDGLLFYTAKTTTGDTVVKFTNLHDMLMSTDIDPKDEKSVKILGSGRYQEYEASQAEKDKRGQVSGDVFRHTNFSDYSTRYYFRGHANDFHAYMLGFSSAGVRLLSTVGQYSAGVPVLTSSPEMLFVREGYLYYMEASSIYRTDIFKTPDEKRAESGSEGELLTDRDVISGAFKADIVAGHLVFFASYDRWTEPGTAYAYFKKLRPGSVSFFVGTLAEEDIPTDEELEAYFDGDYDD